MATGDLLSFGPYLLDTEERRLTRDGADVRMASRHLDLLCLLASHPGQVIPKEMWIEGAWRHAGWGHIHNLSAGDGKTPYNKPFG